MLIKSFTLAIKFEYLTFIPNFMLKSVFLGLVLQTVHSFALSVNGGVEKNFNTSFAKYSNSSSIVNTTTSFANGTSTGLAVTTNSNGLTNIASSSTVFNATTGTHYGNAILVSTPIPTAANNTVSVVQSSPISSGYSHGFAALEATTSCTGGTSQVALSFQVWDAGTTTGSSSDAVTAVDNFISILQNGFFNPYTSFNYSSGDVTAFMWIGTMVQNSGAVDALNQFIDEINFFGILDTKIFQYTTGDPAMGLGMIINNQADDGLVQDAVRTWSMGKSYTAVGSRFTTISDYLCYFSYADRKTGSDDYNAGPCVYKRVEAGVDVGTFSS